MARLGIPVACWLAASCAAVGDRPRPVGLEVPTRLPALPARPDAGQPSGRNWRARPGPVPTMAIAGDLLVAVSAALEVRAWHLRDLTLDPALGGQLGSVRLQGVGAAGGELWGLGEGWVRRWHPGRREWVPRYQVPEAGEPLLRFLVWEEGVALVYSSHVFLPVTQRRVQAPVLRTPMITARALAVYEAFAQGQRLWIGEAYGHSGSVLAGLDLSTGTWVQTSEHLSGVTGLAGKGDWLLLCDVGMSFMAATGTNLLSFGPDAQLTSGPPLTSVEFEDLERIAVGPDGGVWAVSREDQEVRVSQGRGDRGRVETRLRHHQLVTVPPEGPLVVVADLSAPGIFDADAQGVVGVVRLEAVDERTVVLLPWRGPPVVVRDGVAHRLPDGRERAEGCDGGTCP